MLKNEMNHSPEYSDYLKTLSSEFFLDILENSFIEVTVTDKDGNVLYANPACLEYHGISAEKMWKLNFLTSFQGFWTPPSTATAIEKKTHHHLPTTLHLDRRRAHHHYYPAL